MENESKFEIVIKGPPVNGNKWPFEMILPFVGYDPDNLPDPIPAMLNAASAQPGCSVTIIKQSTEEYAWTPSSPKDVE